LPEKLKKWEIRKQELANLATELEIDLDVTDDRFFNSKSAAEPILAAFRQVRDKIQGLESKLQNSTISVEPSKEHTVVEKPVWLTDNEQAIVALLKEKPLRFKEICEQLGTDKGNTFYYLRELQKKGKVTKTRFSHRNVVYHLVEGKNCLSS